MDKLFVDTDKDDGRLKLVNCHGKRFGYAYGDTKQATKSIAQFIVKACNAHELLVALLKEARAEIRSLHDSQYMNTEYHKTIISINRALKQLED